MEAEIEKKTQTKAKCLDMYAWSNRDLIRDDFLILHIYFIEYPARVNSPASFREEKLTTF